MSELEQIIDDKKADAIEKKSRSLIHTTLVTEMNRNSDIQVTSKNLTDREKNVTGTFQNVSQYSMQRGNTANSKDEKVHIKQCPLSKNRSRSRSTSRALS